MAAPAAAPLSAAAVESFGEAMAALRWAMTSVAVPASVKPAPPEARRALPVDGDRQFVPWIPKVAGEKSMLDGFQRRRPRGRYAEC